MCLVEHKGICCVYDMVEVYMEYWHTDVSASSLWLPLGCVFFVAKHVIGMLS